MSSPVIIVDSVSKIYRPRSDSYQTLRQSAMALFSRRKRIKETQRLAEVVALQNISFKIEPGEIVGIIGNNGAGKSTLLKLLSRVSPPSDGTIRLKGRVGSLLEVGTGFHPELTGRQNIFLNGTLLGMRRFEIEKKFEEIVDFSEVRAFLDLPVKFYSSGMYMRLAFAVAAHLEPEILIIDEILAVGDAAFQQKCIKKVKESGGMGGTIIFVSHHLNVVTSLCSRAIYLDRGEVVADGPVGPTVNRYLETMEFAHDTRLWEGNEGDDQLRLVRTELITDAENATLDTSDSLLFRFDVEVLRPTSGLNLNIKIWSSSERMLAYSAYDDRESGPPIEFPPGLYSWQVRIPGDTFATGSYVIRPSLSVAHRKRVVEDKGNLRFTLVNAKGIGRRYVNPFEGVFRPSWRWDNVTQTQIQSLEKKSA